MPQSNERENDIRRGRSPHPPICSGGG